MWLDDVASRFRSGLGGSPLSFITAGFRCLRYLRVIEIFRNAMDKGTCWMLELRPNCEWCDNDLPPEGTDARICSYECTYCAECVGSVLHNVCPTCGGGFTHRPIRPKAAHRDQLTLGLRHQPASTVRTHSKWTRDEVNALCVKLRDVPPEQR